MSHSYKRYTEPHRKHNCIYNSTEYTSYYSEICVGTEIYISAVHKRQILFIRGYNVLGV